MKNDNILILKGNIVFTPDPDKFETHMNSYLVVDNGLIKGIFEFLPEEYTNFKIKDYGEKLIIPGFVDLHTHASQLRQMGLGMDLQLLEWLNEYTFKEESLFSDNECATNIYENFAHEIIKNGTTRVAAFATIHKESSCILFDTFAAKGIGAYVGKVNMDNNCPELLKENTDVSIKETEEIIEKYSFHPMVKPIITPRFAPTCTGRLLDELGKLAVKHNLPVQSHLSENLDEVKWVEELFPEQLEYHKVYDHYGLFGQTPTLMAHCIHLSENAIECMKNREVIAVHCPDSNMNLASGIMPARKLLNKGVQIGLGSDIGAGHTLSIPQTMLKAIQLSKMYYAYDNSCKPLTLSEVFYMATKGGGKFFGNVGSFEEGYSFDALVIKDIDGVSAELSLIEKLQKFVYIGNTSNIAVRFIAGREINII